jgi:hypothetical protein
VSGRFPDPGVTENDTMINMTEPLTVVQVDHAISQEEAEHIHSQFRLAVKDDRPVIVIGPGTSVTVLEPWQEASRRAWLALLVGTLSMIVALLALIFAYLWTH